MPTNDGAAIYYAGLQALRVIEVLTLIACILLTVALMALAVWAAFNAIALARKWLGKRRGCDTRRLPTKPPTK